MTASETSPDALLATHSKTANERLAAKGSTAYTAKGMQMFT